MTDHKRGPGASGAEAYRISAGEQRAAIQGQPVVMSTGASSTALPMRYYRDPADAVQFDQVRALYQRKRCIACRHWQPEDARTCDIGKQPGKHWCGGFDER